MLEWEKVQLMITKYTVMDEDFNAKIVTSERQV